MKTAGTVLGDLRERADGGFDGWCWAPDRPHERLVVELFVNDTPAVSIVAAMFRRDLLALGYGDGHHGFVLYLPPNLADTAAECLITARERQSGRIFGRLIRSGWPGPPAEPAPLAALSAAIATVADDVLAVRRRLAAPPSAVQLRTAFGRLGALLMGCARAPHTNMVATTGVAHPTLSILLWPPDAGAATRDLAALAPILDEMEAELLIIDPAQAGAFVEAPAAPPARLRILRGGGANDPVGPFARAAATARGRWFVLLSNDGPHPPSVAALLALSRELAAAEPAVLLGHPVTATLARLVPNVAWTERLRLPARLGLLLCVERALLLATGPADTAAGGGLVAACADLALRARLLGRCWHSVDEPKQPPTEAPSIVLPARAAASLRRRWQT